MNSISRTKNNHLKRIGKIHRYWGVGTSLFLLLLSLTGILLHHPAWLGGEGEETLALAVDPVNPRHVLRGTSSSLLTSADGGVTWTEIDMLFPAEHAVSIAFSPDVPGRVYVTLRDLGLIRSDDAGRVWENVPLPFVPDDAGIELQGIAVAPGDGILLSTSYGILVSADSGRTWEWRSRTVERRTLYRLVHNLHTGYILHSPVLAYLYDVAAVGFILLIVTGFSIFSRMKKNSERSVF